MKRHVEAAAASRPVETVDWEGRRAYWLDALDRLYSDIESFLQPYVNGETVRIEYKIINLNEENIGAYDAKSMLIHIGDQIVKLVPVGTILIGSKGRVDIIGSAGTGRLVLIGKARRSFRDMFSVTTQVFNGENPIGAAAALAGRHAFEPLSPRKSAEEDTELAWKFANRPPAMEFKDLTAESFLEMIQDISNG